MHVRTLLAHGCSANHFFLCFILRPPLTEEAIFFLSCKSDVADFPSDYDTHDATSISTHKEPSNSEARREECLLGL